MSEVRPFRIEVGQAQIDDLHRRIQDTRWPPQIAEDNWERGVPVKYLMEVTEYWLASYDWHQWQARLNEFPQFTTVIEDQIIHFLHVRSPEPNAVPLILTHGWPGSFVEFLPIIEPLTNPRAHGGSGGDAFDVVVPSLPGFGYSMPLANLGWNHARIARAWGTLMQRLGYARYGAHGSDTGSIVSPELARQATERVIGVHFSGALQLPTGGQADFEPHSESEKKRLEFVRNVDAWGTGYAHIQATRPKTLAFALQDSPVGQLAWIIEKFREWTDPMKERPDDAVDLDLLLTNVSLYWFTGTASTSAQLYYEVRRENVVDGRVDVPTAIGVYPTDSSIRSIAERQFNLVRWTEFDRGGHFSAMEVPDLVVDDLRAFFRTLR
jgi:epoxide hydrolase